MSLRALRTLIAVAKFGSFARAAEAVCLTQSAVSLHIRSLEEDFNAALFDRSRRVPVLTDAGHRAVERAREIVALYDGIGAELGEGGELSGLPPVRDTAMHAQRGPAGTRGPARRPPSDCPGRGGQEADRLPAGRRGDP